jgi:hypothetical protein
MDEFDQLLGLEEQARISAINEARTYFDQSKGMERGLEDGKLLGSELYYYKGFCDNDLAALLPNGAKTA